MPVRLNSLSSLASLVPLAPSSFLPPPLGCPFCSLMFLSHSLHFTVPTRLTPLSGCGVAQHFLIMCPPHVALFPCLIAIVSGSACHPPVTKPYVLPEPERIALFSGTLLTVSLSYDTTHFLPWIRNVGFDFSLFLD